MSELTEQEQKAVVEGVYDAYRLGRYGSEEYLPMWHELETKPLGTPEAQMVLRAVEAIIAGRDAEVRRAAGEQIAQAIEAGSPKDGCSCESCDTYRDAARIAREVTR